MHFLRPDALKKIEIGKLYLAHGDVSGAKRYFSRLSDSDKSFFYDGLLLELGEFEGSAQNNEILNYKNYLSGVGLETDGVSDYGEVMRYFEYGSRPKSKLSYSYYLNLINRVEEQNLNSKMA